MLCVSSKVNVRRFGSTRALMSVAKALRCATRPSLGHTVGFAGLDGAAAVIDSDAYAAEVRAARGR